MTTVKTTLRDNVAAASFAFITSAILCGAILVATTSMAPAQDLRFPTDRGGLANNGGQTPTQNSWGSRDGTPSGQNWGAKANDSSAVYNGVPSTMPPAPATTLAPTAKK